MEGRVLSAQHQGVCCLQLQGELRHDLADAIDDFADEWLRKDDSRCRQLVIDLSGATFMDSTVIGLLVALARDTQARQLPAPLLAGAPPEIQQLFVQLRLDDVFRQAAAVPLTIDSWVEAAPVDDGRLDSLRHARMILKAHQALVAANPDNESEFAGVVAMFEAEVERLAADAKPQ